MNQANISIVVLKIVKGQKIIGIGIYKNYKCFFCLIKRCGLTKFEFAVKCCSIF